MQQYISNKYSCTKLGCSAYLEPSIKLEKLQLLLNHAFHHSCRLRTDKMSTQGASVFPSYNSLLNWQSGRIFCGGCCVVKYREIPTPNPPEILVTDKPSLARYSSCQQPCNMSTITIFPARNLAEHLAGRKAFMRSDVKWSVSALPVAKSTACGFFWNAAKPPMHAKQALFGRHYNIAIQNSALPFFF